MHRQPRRLFLEPLEDRRMLSTCHVTRLGDTGNGNGLRGDLRYCINKANNLSGADVIDLKVTGKITLTTALPSLVTDIDIQGPGANLLTVDADHKSRVFDVPDISARVRIEGLSIIHGNALNFQGGGIYNAGSLTLVGCTLSDNLSDALFSTDDAFGGGIYNVSGASLTLVSSTVSNNDAKSRGNNAFGGGIYNFSNASLTLIDSTVSNNSAQIVGSGMGLGGGIFNLGMLDIRFSTIADNLVAGALSAGGGVYDDGGFEIQNSILAKNLAPFGPDLIGRIDTSGHNLIGDTAGGSGYAQSDLLNIDPLIAHLANNGGPTQTHALKQGSPAIDSGDNTDAPNFDQRGSGFPRVVNGAVDIGSFEVQPTGVPSDGHPLAVLLTADWKKE